MFDFPTYRLDEVVNVSEDELDEVDATPHHSPCVTGLPSQDVQEGEPATIIVPLSDPPPTRISWTCNHLNLQE